MTHRADYRVFVDPERADGRWLVHVVGAGWTSVRRLVDVQPTARDLLAALHDADPSDFTLDVTWPVPPEALASLQTARTLQGDAEAKQAQAAELVRSLAANLSESLPQQDVAVVLGVSRQRIAQLTSR